ncbi:hypothetical protein DV736_g4881, partial [Chaetothyriales sp. CBS 134916]
MPQFYARYVPPSASTTAPSDLPQPDKRKRPDNDPQQGKTKKDKKRRLSNNDDGQKIKTDGTVDGKAVISKYRATAVADLDHVTLKKTGEESVPEQLEEQTTGGSDAVVGADDHNTKKHAKVLSKFNKSRTTSGSLKDTTQRKEAPQPQPLESHGLEPIPQPQDPTSPKATPSFSTLPAWQSSAVRAVPKGRKKFAELGLSKEIVQNLHQAGMDESFPIQTTVIPLLLGGTEKHVGDVCVSAATGSGKTLAYVLPMVEDLKRFTRTRLRAVIVVPTRELVKQVRQLCDTCIAGTTLKVATAAGSQSLREEQSLLVSEDEIFDPDEYRRRQQTPIDWSIFSVEELIKDTSIARVRTVDHVAVCESKIDILITTPGRLVDHLQSTRGFKLDHVKWLVVDEADRLLNESYQEWIDTIVPALQTHSATLHRDSLLRQMGMNVPPRTVQKVLLSATMTRDISKLNSLGLVNPKLVLLHHASSTSESNGALSAGDNIEAIKADNDGSFHLPASLSERIVPVKEGSEKPLYLLQLLHQQLLSQDPSSGRASSSSSTSPESASDYSTASSDTSSDTSESSDADDRPGAFIKQRSAPPTTDTGSEQSSRSRALIFTRSTASAERLARLLALLWPELKPLLSTLTRSTATSATSRRALRAFRAGRTAILIATDRASRGLDIPNLEHVISYDVPSSALTYVHRVGRTARAGKPGIAWTLVEHREGAWFWREIGGKEDKQGNAGEVKIERNEKPRKVYIELGDKAVKERYEDALKQLGDEVKRG